MHLSAAQKLAVEAYKAGIHEEVLGYAVEKINHCQHDFSLLPTALAELRKSHPHIFRDADESKMSDFDRWNLNRARGAA